MTTNYRRSRRARIYQWADDIAWRLGRSGFKDGLYAGLMVSVFAVLMAYYLAVSI